MYKSWPKYTIIIPSEARFLLGLRVSLYGFRAYFSRASKFSFLLFSATQATSPGATVSKLPQGDHARPINSTVLLDLICSPGKSIFARPKMIAPSWPKAVRPFTDCDDVATRGLSIGLLLVSLLQD
jgi:hypothetical protein